MENDLVSKVNAAAAEFGMAEGAGRVCVALSGGADSVSLLRALCSGETELRVEVCACHLNHGLRGDESDSDERFCTELCGRLGVELYSKRICVGDLREKHESVEEAARRARYAFFEEALAHFGENCVLATAHNANDNAETVLLNLTRGTGLKGLCGIPPVRGLGKSGRRVIRPLIFCTRGDIEEYLGSIGQGYVTDKTNLSEDYTRNKLRRRVLPELGAVNPSVVSVIGRMSRNLRADSEFLETLAENALAETREGRGWNAAAVEALPKPIRARVVARILSLGGIEPSALRIDTAIGLLSRRSARFNPCRDRFFTIRKGVCFTENIKQNYQNKR